MLFDLLNAQPVASSKFHGGGETSKKEFLVLAQEQGKMIDLIVFYNKDLFLDEYIKKTIEQKRIKTYDLKTPEEIKNVFKKEQIDTFYSCIPYTYKRSWIPKSVRFIGTVHGLRLLELPAEKYASKYYSGIKSIKQIVKYLLLKKAWKRKREADYGTLLEALDEIITVSWHSAYSIRYYYPGIANKPIHVLYPPLKTTEMSIADTAGIDLPYILLMGGNRYEKNCYREILSVENLFKRGYLADYRIIVVGSVNKKIIKHISDTNRYIFKDYLETEELERLYKFASVFFYASLNEGFGIPPLEAMRYGVTCVVSGVCSLPEVYGDSVYYVNPYDVDEMSSRLLFATENPICQKTIKNRLELITAKQESDLKNICELITS